METVGQLIGLGGHLSTRPWLVALFAREIDCVHRWLAKTVWDFSPCCPQPDDLPRTPCGTDILAWLPFDPRLQPWWDYYVSAWDEEGQLEAVPMPEDDGGLLLDRDPILEGSPWLRFGVRTPPDLGERPAIEHPRGEETESASRAAHSGRPDFPRVRRERLPDDWDRDKPWLWCDTLSQWVRSRITSRENTRTSGTGRKNGRGALFLSTDPAQNRPLFDVLCKYLRDYWAALEVDQVAQDDAWNTFGTWPFRGTDTGFRTIVDGWPARSNGPAQVHLPLPGGSLTEAARTGRWYRINSNIFVLLTSEAEGLQSIRLEADVVGLAIRLLSASLPLSMSVWEPGLTSARFDFLFKGSGTTHRSMFPLWVDWYTGGTNKPLMVFLRDRTEGTDAQGRAHPADYAITVATEGGWDVFGRAVSALRSLRTKSASWYFSQGTSGFTGATDFVDALWTLGNDLVRVAELVLHESGHTIAWVEAAAATGVSGEWHEGPSHRNTGTDIKTYRFPGDESANLSKHYGLTLAASWWECLLRQNTLPRDRLTSQACKCSGAQGRGLTKKHPHYGGWGRDDDTCFEGSRAGFNFANTSCRPPPGD